MSFVPNPYEPPATACPGDTATSVPSRESLASLIRSFLDSEMTPFSFDERLDAFRGSEDAVIRYVVQEVWYHYDDCDDHLFCFSRQQWDYFQRLLLVLSSNCRIETELQRLWTSKQLMAALSLCSFALIAMKSGWGSHLLILSIPFGLISMALSLWPPRVSTASDPYTQIIFPFATFSDLKRAHRSSGFRKTQYPKHLGTRRIRSPLMEGFWQLHSMIFCLVFSPIPLLFQMLPENQTVTRVVSA